MMDIRGPVYQEDAHKRMRISDIIPGILRSGSSFPDNPMFRCSDQ